MKYRIATNNFPYSTIIADGFESEVAALEYARKLVNIWCFGRYRWHIEAY